MNPRPMNPEDGGCPAAARPASDAGLRTVTYDVVVIGAGLAGLVAAASAASQGARVGVVAQSSGNLGLWSGLVTGSTGGGVQTADAVRFFLDTGEQAGLAYRKARPARGLQLLSPSGTRILAALAPETMAPGCLGDLKAALASGRLLILGFTELADYPAGLIAARARAETGLAVDHRSLSLGSRTGDGHGPRISRLFDDPDWFSGFLDAARRVLTGARPWDHGVSPARPAAIALPPVLGLLGFRRNLAALAQAFGCPVFELPALPPSVPGQRFGRFWRHGLETRGQVSFHDGRRAVRSRVENGRCLWVSDGGTRFCADAFVLATGGVAGGGLEVDPPAFFALAAGEGQDRPREPLFDLELTGRGANWLSWGARVNREGRSYQRPPADSPASSGGPHAGRRSGDLHLANVLPAGWLSGPGSKDHPDALTSIVSGWRAGRAAAALVADARGSRGRGKP